jgi:ABC-type uncharacterized transport system ATPase subunit
MGVIWEDTLQRVRAHDMREKKDVGGLAMLQVSNLVKKFGGIVAVNDVSLKIDGGEVVGLSTAS